MKVLIDEMYPQAIAEQLRARGHDADAVTGRAELRALRDTELFTVAQTEQRAVVTENLPDFILIANDCDERGQVHYGVVLVPPSSYPRSDPLLVGRVVTALDRLLGEHPDTAATSQRRWL